MKIRSIDPHADAPAIAAIYRPFVEETDISFETVAPDEGEMERRLREITSVVPGFLMEDEDGRVTGYCYAHPWKGYAAYSATLETTIYVDPAFARRRIGRRLMERLIAECRERGALTLIACITAGNDASIALHEALGFTKASYFRAVGLKAGRLLDVTDYQLILR